MRFHSSPAHALPAGYDRRVTQSVSTDRWTEAQQAEAGFWSGATHNALLVSRALADQVDAAVWARAKLGPNGLPDGPLAEFGVGPIGVACAHFIDEDRDVVGVEPLALTPLQELRLPAALVAAISASRTRYEHHVVRGESTGLPDRQFAAVVVNNALDHVQDPAALLSEAHRVLVPNGILFIACDAFSELALLKLRLWTARRSPDSTFVKAHPFRFRRQDLFGLVAAAGFDAVADNQPASTRVADVVGRTAVVRLLARKRGD
jgi:SAM-dependent methyltransferase